MSKHWARLLLDLEMTKRHENILAAWGITDLKSLRLNREKLVQTAEFGMDCVTKMKAVLVFAKTSIHEEEAWPWDETGFTAFKEFYSRCHDLGPLPGLRDGVDAEYVDEWYDIDRDPEQEDDDDDDDDGDQRVLQPLPQFG